MENELEKRVELEKRILQDLFEKAVVMKSEYVKDYENVMKLKDVVRYIRENYENGNNI